MSQIEKVALRGARLTTLAHGVAVVAQIAYFLWASRELGPTAIGRYQFVVIAVTFVSLLADLGLGDTLVQDRRPVRALLPGMVRASLLTATCLVAAGYAAYLSAPGLREIPLLAAIALVLWITLLDGPALLAEKTLHREFAFGRVATIEVTTQLLHTGLGALLVGLWNDVSGMLVAFVVYRGLRAVWLAASVSARGLPLLRGGESRLVDRTSLRFGLTVVFERGMSHVNSRLDRILLGVLAGEAVVGLYTLGRQLFIEPVLRLNPILVTVAQPLLARVQDDDVAFRRYLLRIYKSMATLLTPALLGMWAVHGGILALVLDPQWAPVSTIALPLALSALPRMFAVSSTVSALARGWATHNARISIVYFVALLVLPTAGHAIGGLGGFAWGIVATSVVHLATIGVTIVWRGHGIGLAPVLRVLRGPVAAAVLMVVAVDLVRTRFEAWTLPTLVVCIATGVVAYPLALALLDRDYVRWIWREGLGRVRS